MESNRMEESLGDGGDRQCHTQRIMLLVRTIQELKTLTAQEIMYYHRGAPNTEWTTCVNKNNFTIWAPTLKSLVGKLTNSSNIFDKVNNSVLSQY